jgi:hypothetical protein
MCIPRTTLAFLAAAATAFAASCNRPAAPLTPEAASAKGDALLREMSTNMAALKTFSYTADERREHFRPGGAKEEQRFSRNVVVRRPNAFTFRTKGDERDGVGWYDGKQVTFVSNRGKVWARGPIPGTLDEALDFLSAEYAIQMPTADLLYSSPYDALMTKDTTGGWVDVQKVGDLTCDHLAYRQEVVDWEIWLGENRRLPCQVKITYKNDPGQPVTMVTYHDFNTSPQVSDATFTPQIPDGYQRIKIMRHATVDDPKVEEAPADPPAASGPAKRRPQ